MKKAIRHIFNNSDAYTIGTSILCIYIALGTLNTFVMVNGVIGAFLACLILMIIPFYLIEKLRQWAFSEK
jgi:hypothetical protein